jgi:Domain of unknown function (DUF2760)
MFMDTTQILLIAVTAVVAVLVLELLVVLAMGGGSLARFGLAWKAFGKVLGDASAAEKIKAVLNPPPPAPPKLSGEPVRLLALLQQEARLVDFLLEDISHATPEQIAAGVRAIHPKAQQALKERLSLEPILPNKEDETVSVPPGFDPSAVQVTGNVTGSPPFKGVLVHHGWRVKGYKIPPTPTGQDDLVLVPAQVEIP